MAMLSCKESTHLISEALDQPLTWRRKLALYFHLMICIGCRRFSKQQTLLRQAFTRLREKPEQIPLEVEAPSTQTEKTK